MNNSLVLYTTSNGNYGNISMPDCCETLGSTAMNNKNKNGTYSYIVIIPHKEVDDFFKIKENIEIYLSILSDIFNFHCIIKTNFENIVPDTLVLYPSDTNFYIEVMSKTKRSNKEVVGLHTCIRYLWYLHFSNIAIACVNLYKMKILPDALAILAIASSYQTQVGRALLPNTLSNIDAFIYFPDKEKILTELGRGINFNTAFMKTQVYYQPVITIKGNFFEDSKPSTFSAKNFIQSLGTVDTVDDIPPVMVQGIHKALDKYLSVRNVYYRILDTIKETKQEYVSQIIITDDMVEKGEILFTSSDGMGISRKNKLNFKLND